MHQGLEDHKRQLAEQLLRDTEQASLLRLNAWLLVARRLAKVTDNNEIYSWLGAELLGYDQATTDPVQKKYARLTGRLIHSESGEGDWRPIAEIEADTGCPYRRNIEARLQSLIHDFATDIYYQLEFSNQTESTFQFQRSVIDMALANYIGDSLNRIPTLYDRLAKQDRSAVGPMLETCMQMIDAFSMVTIRKRKPQLPGNAATGMSTEDRKDLVEDFVRKNCKESTRVERLIRSINQLVSYLGSAGAQSTLPEEAKYLVIQTYITLAEIYSLKQDRLS